MGEGEQVRLGCLGRSVDREMGEKERHTPLAADDRAYQEIGLVRFSPDSRNVISY